MLKRNLLRLLVILFAVIIIYFLKNNFTEYNLSKSISACIFAQKKTSKSFDLEKSKKYCEETVRKQKEAY
tara:strand:+ start:339 stop:548 length:210 start_codon:yes stop_codon:yes gene_type:complete